MGRQVDDPGLVVLRLDEGARDVVPLVLDADAAVEEIDVRPVERDEFAQPQAGLGAEPARVQVDALLVALGLPQFRPEPL